MNFLDLYINDDTHDWSDQSNNEYTELVIEQKLNLNPDPEDILYDQYDQNNMIDQNTPFDDDGESDYIFMEDIVDKNPITLETICIIHYECAMAYSIKSLIDNIKNDMNYKPLLTKSIEKINDIIIYIKWINNASKILADKIGQSLQQNEYEYPKYSVSHIDDSGFISRTGSDLRNSSHNSVPAIIRSSYNFCLNFTKCKNFYDKDELPTCKNHHYVHALLKYDTDSIISFLEYAHKENLKMTKDIIDNLYSSAQTIYFVLRHMHKEISHVNFFTENNCEIYHRNNPFDTHKKNRKKPLFVSNSNKNKKNNMHTYPRNKSIPPSLNLNSNSNSTSNSNSNRFAVLSNF